VPAQCRHSHVPVTGPDCSDKYDTLVPPCCRWYWFGVVDTCPAIDMLCCSLGMGAALFAGQFPDGACGMVRDGAALCQPNQRFGDHRSHRGSRPAWHRACRRRQISCRGRRYRPVSQSLTVMRCAPSVRLPRGPPLPRDGAATVLLAPDARLPANRARPSPAREPRDPIHHEGRLEDLVPRKRHSFRPRGRCDR
jgi:hypothetical protein